MPSPPRGLAIVLACGLIAIAGPARAQTTLDTPLNAPQHPVFGHTIMYGSGFIMTPHAFVAEGTSLFGSGVAMITEDVNDDLMTLGRGAVGITLGGVLEVGATSLDALDRWSGFAKLRLLKQSGIFPSLAVGVQNLPAVDSAGRYGLVDPFRVDNLEDAASFYGVFTYVAGPGGTNFPSWVVISGGWGSGLFLKDVPALSEDGHTGGLFGALAVDFQAAEKAFIRVMVEHDGFDTNLGLTAYLAGLEVSVGVLSVDEGSPPVPVGPGEAADPTRQGVGFLYNQTKPFISIAMDIRALGELPWIWGGGGDD